MNIKKRAAYLLDRIGLHSSPTNLTQISSALYLISDVANAPWWTDKQVIIAIGAIEALLLNDKQSVFIQHREVRPDIALELPGIAREQFICSELLKRACGYEVKPSELGIAVVPGMSSTMATYMVNIALCWLLDEHNSYLFIDIDWDSLVAAMIDQVVLPQDVAHFGLN